MTDPRGPEADPRGASRAPTDPTLVAVRRLVAFGLGLSLAVFALVGAWGIVEFTALFCGGFGGLAWYGRSWFAHRAGDLGLRTLPGFVALGVSVTVGEELLAWATGGTLAQPVLWVDLLWVGVGWLSWLLTWRQFVARRFAFSTGEALLSAGLTGVLFEQVGSGFVLRAPVAALVLVPVEIAVYATVFLLPWQAMTPRGQRTDWVRWPVAVVVPYLASIPPVLVLDGVLRLLGQPVA